MTDGRRYLAACERLGIEPWHGGMLYVDCADVGRYDSAKELPPGAWPGVLA